MVGWGAFLLPLLVLIVGPTEFITNSIINAIGLTTQNFLQELFCQVILRNKAV